MLMRLFSNSQRFCKYPNANEVIFKIKRFCKYPNANEVIFKFAENLKRHERCERKVKFCKYPNDVSVFSKSRDFVNIRMLMRLFSNSQRFCKYPNANEVIFKLCKF